MARIPHIDAFLQLKGQRNRAARHLVPKRFVDEGDATAAIVHLRQLYAFVGVQERYELGLRALTARLAVASRPLACRCVNDGAAEERAAALERPEQPTLRTHSAEVHALEASGPTVVSPPRPA